MMQSSIVIAAVYGYNLLFLVLVRGSWSFLENCENLNDVKLMF